MLDCLVDSSLLQHYSCGIQLNRKSYWYLRLHNLVNFFEIQNNIINKSTEDLQINKAGDW